MAMTTPGPVRVAFWHATTFRRFWVTNLLGSVLQPLLYLLGLGVGVGALVDRADHSADALGGVSYVAFISPGLMVTTAMSVAAIESLWPILAGTNPQLRASGNSTSTNATAALVTMRGSRRGSATGSRSRQPTWRSSPSGLAR